MIFLCSANCAMYVQQYALKIIQSQVPLSSNCIEVVRCGTTGPDGVLGYTA